MVKNSEKDLFEDYVKDIYRKLEHLQETLNNHQEIKGNNVVKEDVKTSGRALATKLVNDMLSMSTVHGINYLSSGFAKYSR